MEVNERGDTLSHVFRGAVRVQIVAADRNKREIVLSENESARVARGAGQIDAMRSDTAGGIMFVRHLPEWVPIKVFNTGAGLKEGMSDTHWQLAGRSDERDFRPRAAVVTTVERWHLPNVPDRSQWISLGGNLPDLPGGVVYTFRTTFALPGLAASGKAVLRGKFIVDDHVAAMRLNGRSVTVPEHENGVTPFNKFTAFSVGEGFVEGPNVLEIDVSNGPPHVSEPTPMLLRVELEGAYLFQRSSGKEVSKGK